MNNPEPETKQTRQVSPSKPEFSFFFSVDEDEESGGSSNPLRRVLGRGLRCDGLYFCGSAPDVRVVLSLLLSLRVSLLLWICHRLRGLRV